MLSTWWAHLLQSLNAKPWLNLLFLVLAILGIAVSLFLYFKSKREKRPVFSKLDLSLIRENVYQVPGIEILHSGKKIPNLTLSRFALWNAGKEVIDKTDIAPKEPLRIEAKRDVVVLSAEIEFAQNPTNNFDLAPVLGEGIVFINFDYFAGNEGVVVRVYHTGKEKDDVQLRGVVKGVSSILPGSFASNYYMSSFERVFDPYYDSTLAIRRL